MISETEKSPKFLTSETTFTEPRKRNLRMEANMRRQNLQRTEIKDEKRGEKEMAKDGVQTNNHKKGQQVATMFRC